MSSHNVAVNSTSAAMPPSQSNRTGETHECATTRSVLFEVETRRRALYLETTGCFPCWVLFSFYLHLLGPGDFACCVRSSIFHRFIPICVWSSASVSTAPLHCTATESQRI
eukprot:1307513-Amphidinium_carterae.1